MPKSNFDFTVKFFHPPQRTVPFHNGLLDTRTKHTIAQDRLVVAEQRIIAAERRKSTTNVQLLAFEQKQIEKRLANMISQTSPPFLHRSMKMRGRSTSDVILSNMRRSSSWNVLSPLDSSQLQTSLRHSNQNLLHLPPLNNPTRRFSAYSEGDTPDYSLFASDGESGEEGEHEIEVIRPKNIRKASLKKLMSNTKPIMKLKSVLPPIVAIIPPEDDNLFLIQ